MPPVSKLLLQEVIMAIQEDRTGTWHAYGKLKPVDGNPLFADYLAVHFPEVVATIDEADFGKPHLEVDALKLATRNAILNRDWTTVQSHFTFVDGVLETAKTELHEAIGISYLVNLFYGETSLDFAKARTLLPRRLAAALEIMERHYEELSH
jgi:hypothetical protein